MPGSKEPALHLIERDTPVLGGVWASTVRENLWVDPKHYILDDLVDEVEFETRGSDSELDVVDAAYREVTRYFKRQKRKNKKSADRVAAGLVGHYRHKPLISIWRFAEQGAGNCRHKTLVLAAVLERLQEEGYIHGSISVDRNRSAYRGRPGHAWVRYTDTDGTIWILDVAHSFNDSLEQAFDFWVEHPHKGWAYWRPGDFRYLNSFRETNLRYWDL